MTDLSSGRGLLPKVKNVNDIGCVKKDASKGKGSAFRSEEGKQERLTRQAIQIDDTYMPYGQESVRVALKANRYDEPSVDFEHRQHFLQR